MIRPSDPFDAHPALPEALQTRARELERLAGESIDQQAVTDRAFQPALASWDGVAAAELAAAPVALRRRVRETASLLSWASVPLRLWPSRCASST